MAPPEAARGGIGAAVARANQRARRSLLRNHGGGHAPVSYLELFFDLVFVFAITQLSHSLLHHLSWLGLAEVTLLFLAVWWAWIYTTWITNWANPDRLPVRILLLVIMVLSLAMAAAVPQAFGPAGAVFAGSYVAIQLGRTVCMLLLMRGESADRARNMARIAAWFACALPFWIGGILASEHARIGWWLAALAIEYAGPMVMFRTPGLGASTGNDWDISGTHMAERCALFMIIALGEGIVVTGSAFAGEPMTGERTTAFLIAFIFAALLWWLYFDIGAERGSRMMSNHSDVGRLARNAYTYLHMPIVLGVVISAVGDGLLLNEAGGMASRALIVVQAGGALLFIAGLGLFKRFASPLGNFPMSHMVAMALFLAVAGTAWVSPMRADTYSGLCVGVLAMTCAWEWGSYHRGWLDRFDDWGLPYPASLRTRAERRRAARERQSA